MLYTALVVVVAGYLWCTLIRITLDFVEFTPLGGPVNWRSGLVLVVVLDQGGVVHKSHEVCVLLVGVVSRLIPCCRALTRWMLTWMLRFH